MLSFRRSKVIGFFFLVIGTILLFSGFFNHLFLIKFGPNNSWVGEFLEVNYSNFSSEFISIGITVLVINSILEREQQNREWKNLAIQMGSVNNGDALTAIKRLEADGLLVSGFLSGRSFPGANLENALLSGALMERCDFDNCILSGANLSRSNLKHSTLRRAKLILTNLESADLKWVNLNNAELLGCELSRADLENANLRNCNLKNALVTDEQLSKVASLRGATMPSGERYNGRFNLPGDLNEYQSLKSQKTAGEIHEFFYVPKEIYERGQY